jgi:starch-binding outer membrane protein, SusD/RagB family
MSHRANGPRGRAVGRMRLRITAGFALVLAVASCDLNLLEQEAPSRVEEETLRDPSNAALLVRSAASEFECALAQHIFATGLVAHELRDGSLSEAYFDYDRRTLSPARAQYAQTGCSGALPGNYMALSSARFLADNALGLLDGWTDAHVPDRAQLTAQAAAYAGYSLVLLGESMCTGAIDVGPELSRAQLLEEAERRFDRVLNGSGASAQIAALARVGRARARLGLGRLAEAGTDAALVPAGFELNADFSDASTRRRNRIYTALYRVPVATVDAAYRDLTVDGVPDTRVVVINAGRGAQDADVPLFQPAKYADVSAPIRIASWEEAQLILAESLLAAGDTPGAAQILSMLRTEAGLPGYAGGTPAEVRAQLIEERRRALFLEGHRLGDLIRYELPLVPAPGTPFHRGGSYGSQLCFPLPDIERNNNPNI